MDKILQEDTTGAAAPNIATVDHDITIGNLFHEINIPSLGRQIFAVLPVKGPTAAIFNLRNKAGTNDVELVRASVEVYASTAIKTNITSEAIQDIRALYSEQANDIIAKLLRGLANLDENTKTLAFLETKSLAYASLTLSNAKNAETNLFELVQRVQEIVLKMNIKNGRTYGAYAVIPFKGLAGIMALSGYQLNNTVNEAEDLFIAQFGKTKFYFNPDPLSTTAYVGLVDISDSSRSSGIFSPYNSDVIESQHPDTGVLSYHIFNRYAITASPLHILGDEMFYKFTVTIV